MSTKDKLDLVSVISLTMETTGNDSDNETRARKLNDQHIIGISTLRIEMLKEAHMTRARAVISI